MLSPGKIFRKNNFMTAELRDKILGACRIILKIKCFYLSTIRRFFCLKVHNINLFESRIYSQNGEDGILAGIFSQIGRTNKFFVEFGVEDGSQCNTRYLREYCGWKGLMMGGCRHLSGDIKQEFVTAGNINMLFEKYMVPDEFDLLSIDIDGNDYWVWKALSGRYRPRVVVIEYNAKYKPPQSVVILYDPQYVWDGSDYFGASLSAFVTLAGNKGYTLAGCDSTGTNAFFVNNADFEKYFSAGSIEKLYRLPRYGAKEHNFCHPPSDKKMIEI